MFGTPTFSHSAALKNLRRLFVLRNILIAFLSSTALALFYLDIPLHRLPILAAVGSMLLLNGITLLQLRRGTEPSDTVLSIQLVGDLATLTMLFYFTGGYSNPLVWMFLLPIAIAAVALPPWRAWLLAGLAMGCYSLLVFFYVPLSHLHAHYREGIGLDTHLAGMWLGFIVSASLIAGFVSRIGQNLRDYDHLIAQTRETALESERMLALGALATAAAHELGTPLATMAVLSKELLEEHAGHPELADSLQLMRIQIGRCKAILSSLTASAGQARADNTDSLALDEFLQETVGRWRDTRPALHFDCALKGDTPAPRIAVDRTLGQALINLLDNAADASPQQVAMQGEWDRKNLRLEIRDHGPGLSPETASQVGTPFFTTKPESGMGLGLYLARIIFGRFGGTVALQNHPQGGTITSIQLPLARLVVESKP